MSLKRELRQSGLQRLLREKIHFKALQKQQNALRQAKLKSFLDAYHHASQWAVCLAALYDAQAHGVPPTDSMIEDAMKRCGASGRINEAKQLYTNFYQSLSRPRPLSVHVTFMSACAACGAFEEAKKHLDSLVSYDVRRFQKNSSHLSIVTDDLMTEYLRAALAAHVRGQREIPSPSGPSRSSTYSSIAVPTPIWGRTPEARSSSTSSQDGGVNASDTQSSGGSGAGASPSSSSPSSSFVAVWEVALRDLVCLRQDYPPKLFRSRLDWTPLLLESAAQLADAGGQWLFALRLLRSAGREQALIPPEAYDAVIRVCYQNHRYGEVVQLLETMIAAQSSPDERSVRLGIVAAEEVEAKRAQDRVLLSAHGFPQGFHSHATREERGSSSSVAPVDVIPPFDSPLNGAGGDVSSPSHALDTTTTRSSTTAWSLSLTLFQSMRLNGVLMYQQSYESPLRACALAGKWEEAMTMLDHMRQDGRPVSTALFRVVAASRIEYQCESFSSVRHLLSLPSLQGDHGIGVLYLAAMRWCVRHKDWRNLESLHKEMLDRDIPESYEKMRLMIEAAYHQGRYHAVLARFSRFYNITTYERKRVDRDKSARLYEDDFYISAPLLDMVLAAHESLVREEKKKDKEFLAKSVRKSSVGKKTIDPLEGRRRVNTVNEEGCTEGSTTMEHPESYGKDNDMGDGTTVEEKEIDDAHRRRKKDPLLLIAYRAAKEMQERLFPSEKA